MNADIDALASLERLMLEDLDPALTPDALSSFLAQREAIAAGWSQALLASRLQDLRSALADGRNLFREQKLHMLARKEGRQTPPDCPPPSMEQLWLVDWLCKALGNHTAACPFPDAGGTGLYGELMTYSVNSLRLYASHVERSGKAIAAC